MLATSAGAQQRTPPVSAGGAIRNESVTGVRDARDKHPKMDANVAATARTYREMGESVALQAAPTHSLTVRDGRVRVVVEANDPAGARALVQQARGTIENEYGPLLQVLLPAAALEPVAGHASVHYLRRPLQPVPLTVDGQGPGATGATAWQAANLRGNGVKVAIVDGGFDGYTARQAAGELPTSLVTKNFCVDGFTTGTEHGTAVSEIVYEMAPAAQLYLICIDSDISLAQARDYVKSQGIIIVNHSMAWFVPERSDGTGSPTSINGIVADAHANGILWVNAAGNSGQAHWSGVFWDPDGNGVHNFAGTDEGNTVSIGAGQQACYMLQWESWPTTAQDFDLFLRRSSNGTVVAGSAGEQSGTQPPDEFFCYTNSGPRQDFSLSIERYDATESPRFDLWSLDTSLEYTVAEGSIELPASSPHTLAVGAVCWQNSALEPYSSQGPTIDGRTKPDLMAPAAVSSATYGLFTSCGRSGFTGTSASAPHVAGAAALVKQANPSFTADQLRAFLTGHTIDLGAPGVDNVFGAGRLDLGTPPASGPTAMGGRGLALEAGAGRGATLTWTDGDVETGYLVIRWSPTSGIVFLPRNLVPLPANATRYTDSEALTDATYCYLVITVGGTPASVNNVLGFSDFLCLYPGSALGTAPSNLQVQLNEGRTATLSWSPPAGVSGYTLTATTFDGALPQVKTLGATATSTTHDTQGKSTCYELVALGGAQAVGTASKVCVVPGIATVGATASAQSVTTPSAPAPPGVQSAAGSALRGNLPTLPPLPAR